MRIRTKLLFRVLNKHQTKLSNMGVSEARIYFDALSENRRKPHVASVTERKIGSDALVRIRVYSNGSTTCPTILYFHGGGFVVGSIESHDTLARLLCNATGCTIVSVDYGLAPEHVYPAGIEDGITALRWLQSQAEYNSSDVFIAGDSAGGQIALYTYLQASKSLRANVKGLLLFYPALDPRLVTDSVKAFGVNHFVTKANMKLFWETYLGSVSVQWPVHTSEISDFPPTLIQTADYDILRDEGRLFAEQLRAAGVAVTYHMYKQTAHGFLQVPSIISGRNKALRDIAAFINDSR